MSVRLPRSLTALVTLVWFAAPACGESPSSGGDSTNGGRAASGGGAGAPASTSGGVGGSGTAGALGAAGTPGSAGSGGPGASGGEHAAGGSGGSGGSGAVGGSSGVATAGSGGADNASGVGGGAGSAEAGSAGAGGLADRCPNAGAATTVVELEVPNLSEASGLCASRVSPGVFFTHNDSGTSSDVYAFLLDGSLVATLELAGALSEDWEDIGVGPGPESGKSYLYVADIGDNDRIRTTSIVVQRALEPALSASERGQTLSLPFESLYFSYPDEPHNAETLLVDPVSGDLYIATKGDAEGSRVYVAHAPHSTTAITALEYVTTLAFGVAPLSGSPLATGGSVAPDGSALLIRTYDGVFWWPRSPGTSLAEALLGAPCSLPVAKEGQGEGVTFAADAWSYFTVGEGDSPTLSSVLLSP